jgi:putative acetyltransferase
LRAVRKVTDVVLEARSAELDALYDDPSVVKLIETHVFAARRQTAPGSAHALDLSGLKSPDISVWVACRSGDLVGTGALKRLSTAEGEVKSMYTAPSARRCGVARVMLAHIIDSASGEGLARLSLETGSWSYFEPAIALYASFGFVKCRPFGDYREDPNSMSAGAKLPTSDGP